MLPARPSIVVTVANILCLILDPTSAAALARIGIYKTNGRNALTSTARPVRQQVTPVNRESFLVSVPTVRRPVKPVDLLLFHQPDEQSVIQDTSPEVSTSTTPELFTTPRRNDDRIMAMSSLVYSPEDGAQMSKNYPKQPRPPFFINDQVVQHDWELSSLSPFRLPIDDEKESLDKIDTSQEDHSSDLFKWLTMVQQDPVEVVEESNSTEPSQEDYEDEDYFTDEDEDYFVDETTTDMAITEPTPSYSTTTEGSTTTTKPPVTMSATDKPKLQTGQHNLKAQQQVELELLPVQIPNPFLFQIAPGRDRTADKSETVIKPIKSYEHNYGESMYSNSQQVSNQFNMYQQNKPVVTQKPVHGSNFLITSTPAGPPYMNPTTPNTLIDLFFQHHQTKPISIPVPINYPNINPVTPPTNLFDWLFQQQTNSPVLLPIGSSSVSPVTPPTNLFDLLFQQQPTNSTVPLPIGSSSVSPVTPPTNLFDFLLQQQTNSPVLFPIGSSSVSTVTPPTNLFDFLLQQPTNSPVLFPIGSSSVSPVTPPSNLFQQQQTNSTVPFPIGSSSVNPSTPPTSTSLFDLLFQQPTNSPVQFPIVTSSVSTVTPPTNLFDFLLQQQTNRPTNLHFPAGNNNGTATTPIQNFFELLFQQQTKPPVNTQTPIGSSSVTTTPPPSSLADLPFSQPTKPPNFPVTNLVSTPVPFRPPFFTTTTAQPPTSSQLDIFKPQQPAGLIESQMGNFNGNFGGSPGSVFRPPFFNLPVSSQPVQQPTTTTKPTTTSKPTSVATNPMGENFISTVRPTKAPSTGLYDLFQQQKPPLVEYQMGNSFIQPAVSNRPTSVGGSTLQLPMYMLPGYYQMGGYYYYPTTTANLTTTTPSYSPSTTSPCPPTSTSTSSSFTDSFTTATSRPPPYWSTTSSTVWMNLPTIPPTDSPTMRPPFFPTSRPPYFSTRPPYLTTHRPSKPASVRPPDSPTINPPYITTTVPSTATVAPPHFPFLPPEEEPPLATFFFPVASSGSSSSSGSGSSSSSGSTSSLGTGTDISSSTGFGAAGFLLFFFFIGLPIIIGVLAVLNFSDIVLGVVVAGVIPIALFLILGVTGILTTKRSGSFSRRWFGLELMSVELNELRRLEQHVTSLLESFPFREEDR